MSVEQGRAAEEVKEWKMTFGNHRGINKPKDTSLFTV